MGVKQLVISCRCSDSLKEVVVEAAYSCGAAACHRLRRHPRLGDSRAELELVNSLEWRPLGHTLRGPQLLADYVSYLTYDILLGCLFLTSMIV